MVATESKIIFTWSMAISIVLTEYESYKMTHTYNEEGYYYYYSFITRNKGGIREVIREGTTNR